MGRFLQSLSIPGVGGTATLARFCLLALTAIAPCGCANSPYRQVMREMNQPAEARQAGRVREVSRQHQQAMDQLDETASLLAAIIAGQSPPSEWDAYRCRDAVELCDWWIFNLERANRSLEDLAPGSGLGGPAPALSDGSRAADVDGETMDLARLSHYQDLIMEFERVQQIMKSVVRQYAEAAEAIAQSAVSGEGLAGVDLPDLVSLREIVAAATLQAEALVAPPESDDKPRSENAPAKL